MTTTHGIPGSTNASVPGSITAPASTSVQGTVSITVPVNEPTAASDTHITAGTASLDYHDGGIVTGVYVVGDRLPDAGGLTMGVAAFAPYMGAASLFAPLAAAPRLTDAEIDKIWRDTPAQGDPTGKLFYRFFARAIEAHVRGATSI